MRVVVALARAGAPDERRAVLPSEKGHDMVVQDFPSVVGVHGCEAERETAHVALQGLQCGVLAPVPRGAEFQPLRFPVGAVQDPEEVVGADAASKRERVGLYVAGRHATRHDLLAGGGGNQFLYPVRSVPA